MCSNFATAMQDTAQTRNGAISLYTPDITGKTSGRLGLFFKSIRNLNIPSLYEYLREAAQESVVDTFLLVFHIRDCRGGKGERELGRRAFTWLFLNYPKEFQKIAYLIPEYGRWDDIIQLWPGPLNLTNLKFVCNNWCANVKNEEELGNLRTQQRYLVNIVGRQLVNDLARMEAGQPITICAKWAPTEKDSLDRKHNIVKTLCKIMNINSREYRQRYTTPMREYLRVVERYMCDHKWEDIEYSKVPSCAMKRLKKAFEKHCPELFNEWKTKLSRGEVDVKAKQLFPHEIISTMRKDNSSDTVLEAQWKVLENQVKDLGALSDSICVCDVSGSMTAWCYGTSNMTSFVPIDVSVGLSLIISNAVQGPFHNHIITFSEKPQFHLVKNESIFNRCKSLLDAPWGGNTNFQAVFDLILTQAKRYQLNQKDMPKRLFIFSDMQFDKADRNTTNFKAIDQKYTQSGYKRPQIIFWNLDGSTSDFPVSVDNNNTAMVSGFSPSILKAILHGKDFSPYTVMRETLDMDRYNPVRKALSQE